MEQSFTISDFDVSVNGYTFLSIKGNMQPSEIAAHLELALDGVRQRLNLEYIQQNRFTITIEGK